MLASGAITAPQLLTAVEVQDRSNPKLGACAVAMGLATQFEIGQVLALQATEDLMFGEAAIRLGILDEAQLDRLLEARENNHVPLGDALVTLGFMTRERVETAAAEFIVGEARIEAEVVTIPDDLPYRDLAFELFHLAHKLFLRVCDLASKTDRMRVVTDVLPLSDRNVRIALSGAVETSVLLGVPHRIASDMASRFSGEDPPNDEDIDNVVCELGALLCRNLVSVVAEQGRRLQCGEPELVAPRMSLPPGRRFAVVPFLTHHGQLVVSLALPPSAET